MMHSIDILMVTHRRPAYTILSLPRLLETCVEGTRVWLWHNGTDKKTLDIVASYRTHPRVYRFYHSIENVKLHEPTNWLWTESKGSFLGKVDDDCLVPHGWIETLLAAHEANRRLGAVGCWHYLPGDVPEAALRPRVVQLNEHQLLRNCWIGGSGYLLKREAQTEQGLLRPNQSWPKYVINLSARGWMNGWYYPFLYQDHMDDPRSPNTQIVTDKDVQCRGGLSAQMRGLRTVEEILARQQDGLKEILASSLDPRSYLGWRARVRRLRRRLFSTS